MGFDDQVRVIIISMLMMEYAEQIACAEIHAATINVLGLCGELQASGVVTRYLYKNLNLALAAALGYEIHRTISHA